MSDYVLESNPALERLFERLRAPGEPPPPEESSLPNRDAKRSPRGRRSKVHAEDRTGILRGDPAAAGAKDPADRATVVSAAAIAEEEPVVVEDDLWANHADPQPTDELVLVDFDEEPEVFDEVPNRYDEDEEDADGDEILDLYEYEEPDDEGEGGDGTDEDTGSDWIFNAFEVWMRGAVEDDDPHDEEDLEALDDADQFIDVFDEDLEDPTHVPEPPYQRCEVPVDFLEPTIERAEPYHFAPSALSPQLSVNAGHTKARNKNRSTRQKRSASQAEQDVKKAERSSMKAALASLSQADLEAESGSLLSALGRDDDRLERAYRSDGGSDDSTTDVHTDHRSLQSKGWL
jgi:hypothetical protein